MFQAVARLLRLISAELVRQRLAANGQAETAARLIKVLGWGERDVDRYPGTSSHWVENYVDIGWMDDEGAGHVFTWHGTKQSLLRELEQLVEEY